VGRVLFTLRVTPWHIVSVLVFIYLKGFIGRLVDLWHEWWVARQKEQKEVSGG
jgi:hypothetical protein